MQGIIRQQDGDEIVLKRPENLEKIFQPLFSTKARGIGFGLSISKKVVESHGGEITAKSKPGEGAAIILELPLMGVTEEGNS